MKFLVALLVLGSSLAAQAVSLQFGVTSDFVGKDNGSFHVYIHEDTVNISEVNHLREPIETAKIVAVDDRRPVDGPLVVKLSNGATLTVSSGYNLDRTVPIHYNKDGKSIQLIPQLSVRVLNNPPTPAM